MTIYRGPGGGGNADSDAEVNQLAAFALEAENSAIAAAASAAAAAGSEADAIAAAASAAAALVSQNAAAASAAAALVSKNAAETAKTAAELAETNAETAQTAAQLAETNAETAETNAAASAVSAASSASTATTQAGLASTSASNAATSASNAATSASGASTSASNAASSASSAAASYDSFDDRYLGAKSADPTLDNDGNALLTGALYWNTVSNQMRVYSGSVWIVSYLPADGYVQKTGDTMSGSLSVTGTVTATTFSGAGTSLTGTASALSIGGNAATATTATNQSGGTVSATSISDSGNLTFTGTGNRITGDFSNGTLANRVAFQTSTVNGSTDVSSIPNGTSVVSAVRVKNSSDPANSSDMVMFVNNAEARLYSLINGTGTYLPMTFYTGGSERVRVDTSGNVGIGTSSPTNKLSVNGNVPAACTGSFVSASSGSISAGFSDNINSSLYIRPAAGGTVLGTDGGGTIRFATNGNTTAEERMRIDSIGNVGIGTSSPYTKLQVTGTIKVATGNAQGILSLGDGGGASVNCGVWRGAANAPTTDGNYLNFGGYDGLVFATGNAAIGSQTERARIDSSGNLLVGTTSQLGSARVTIKTPDGSGALIPLTLAVGLVSDGFGGVSFRNPNGAQGSININSTSVSYNTTSDYRLKEDVQPMVGALAKVQALKPVTYKWKVDGSDGQGFIAHELAEVEAGCVTGEKDAVDAEGNPQYQGIDTSFLVATLTAAIQELKAIVDAQAVEIAALKSI